MKIGLISDTHGWIHPSVKKYFGGCDEIWHAGDIGSVKAAGILEEIAPLKAVYGNIDGSEIRSMFGSHLRFIIGGVDVWITHIGGYPGHYDSRIKDRIKADPPDLFICGHSHIARVIHDHDLDLLHINPGAAGYYGFHNVMTIARLTIESGTVTDLELIELGERSKISG